MLRSLLFSLGALTLIAPPLLADDSKVITLRAEPVQLQSGSPTVSQVGMLRFLAGFHLTSDSEGFGGFSGLVIDSESHLTAVSDEGHWLTARVNLNADGTLLSLHDARLGVLCDDDGDPVAGKERRDAEELQELPGRGFLVSFERHHRIVLYPVTANGSHPLAEVPDPFPFPPAIVPTRANSGMEAFAVLHDGRLLTFAEELRTTEDDMIGWIGHPEQGDWRNVTLTPQADFLPTGATVLPSGDVVLLERSYRKERGNRVRLSLLGAASLKPEARLEPRELALLEPPNIVDNMEAIASHLGPGGKTLIYLMSDDNFSDKQRTLLLQFEISTTGPRPRLPR